MPEAAPSADDCTEALLSLSLSANDSTEAEPSSSGEPTDSQRHRGYQEYGCQHYRRRCQLVAPCCGEIFWCRHCHNEKRTALEWDPERRHELERKAVRELVCALCSTRQALDTHCRSCGVAFGAYTCLDCCFFEDDVKKQHFHCGACGICRVGGRDNFFHCDTCGCCYAKILQGNHVCVENSMRQNCPVCFEYLFDSVRQTAVLPCGHTIHRECLDSMQQNRQMSCPLCMKSYADLEPVWRRVDDEIANTPMPSDYANWSVHILCNDCNNRSRVGFHILGLKCDNCSSYNTRRLSIEREHTRTTL